MALVLSCGEALAAETGQAARDAARDFAQQSIKDIIHVIRLPADGPLLLAIYASVVFAGALLFSAAHLWALRRALLASGRLRAELDALRTAPLKRHVQPADRILAVRTRQGLRLVKPEEVEAIVAADDYCELVLENGERLLHDSSLTAIGDRLPGDFRRIHRSAIVNVARLQTIRRRASGGYEAVTRSGEVLPIGRTYRRNALATASMAGSRPAR